MQDMNASATADHKALRALAVAKVPKQPRAGAPPPDGPFHGE